MNSRPWLSLKKAAENVLELFPWPGADYESKLQRFGAHFLVSIHDLIFAILCIEGLLYQLDRVVFNPHDIDEAYTKFKIQQVAALYQEVFLTVTRVNTGREYWTTVNCWRNQLCDLRQIADHMAFHEASSFN